MGRIYNIYRNWLTKLCSVYSAIVVCYISRLDKKERCFTIPRFMSLRLLLCGQLYSTWLGRVNLNHYDIKKIYTTVIWTKLHVTRLYDIYILEVKSTWYKIPWLFFTHWKYSSWLRIYSNISQFYQTMKLPHTEKESYFWAIRMIVFCNTVYHYLMIKT